MTTQFNATQISTDNSMLENSGSCNNIGQAIEVIDHDPFLKKCIGISLIIFTIIVAGIVGLALIEPTTNYIESKITKNNAK